VIARPQKPADNVFFHSGDHRSPLQYVLKRYDKLRFWAIGFSKHRAIMHKAKACHFERAAAKMRNLRIWFTFQVKFVRRSLDFARDDSVRGSLKQYDKLKITFSIRKNSRHMAAVFTIITYSSADPGSRPAALRWWGRGAHWRLPRRPWRQLRQRQPQRLPAPCGWQLR